MPGTDGYFSWGDEHLRGPFYLDGVALMGSEALPVMGWSPGQHGTTFRMADGGGLVQYQFIGGDTPLMHRPLELPLVLQHNYEADYWRIMRAEAMGPVRIWFGLWLSCLWYIPGKNDGQVTWKTDRRLPYSLPGISHASHPPKVLIDGTEQTILTSGDPAGGEVVVPTAGGFATITTPEDISGTFLELRSPFELLVTVDGPSTNNPQANALPYAATFREVQGSGGYTGATE